MSINATLAIVITKSVLVDGDCFLFTHLVMVFVVVMTISDIQERVADAVNALVKYYYREKEVNFSYSIQVYSQNIRNICIVHDQRNHSLSSLGRKLKSRRL